MTNGEKAKAQTISNLRKLKSFHNGSYGADIDRAIKALEQEPCEDAISRDAAIDLIADYELSMDQVVRGIHNLPSVTSQPKIGQCKDCKWWKDSDGIYRRGVGAESQCPINRREVFEGNGYCYMFEPQESEG